MVNHDFIVGDAGGTSTQWRMVKNDVVHQFQTVGFNAYTHDFEVWRDGIEEVLGVESIMNMPTYIYAAGVDTAEQSSEITELLKPTFGNNVEIKNDLIGVARSLCGNTAGNVNILGTGANACFYDGKEVNKVGASLGYILGDEGSGAYLGKKLMQKIFRKEAEDVIIDLFQNEFHLSAHQVIQRLYSEPKPNQFLSSFAPFIHENRNHPDIFEMVKDSFEDFFDAFYINEVGKDIPHNFSGSIAYFFSDILREVGNERGAYIKNIVQSPIAGLVLYHKEND